MKSDKIILTELLSLFGENINLIPIFPKPYCPGGINNVKAIYLGCDPTNTHKQLQFEYAFSQGCSDRGFEKFRQTHLIRLEAIGLNWESVFTQNLCRNYFKTETSKNPIWKQAAQYWLPILKEELDNLFSPDIPVILTSEVLLEALYNKSPLPKELQAKVIYEQLPFSPISKEDNKLHRELIPLYRHSNYGISEKPAYWKAIKSYFNCFQNWQKL